MYFFKIVRSTFVGWLSAQRLGLTHAVDLVILFFLGSWWSLLVPMVLCLTLPVWMSVSVCVSVTFSTLSQCLSLSLWYISRGISNVDLFLSQFKMLYSIQFKMLYWHQIQQCKYCQISLFLFVPTLSFLSHSVFFSLVSFFRGCGCF